jgi:hypothetical protein
MSQINIGGLTIDKFYLGNSDSVQIYLGNIKLYPQSTPPTPVSSCYEIIPQPISQYASTTYDSVYSWSDAKWYMKNNLSQYEEYGVYDVVENISSATTYDGKLAVVGTTEYQYSGGSWSVVGTYEDASTTYEITGEDPYEYEGVELSTTFKIPTADIEELGGWLNFTIRTQDGGRLTIGTTRYSYMGSSSKTGTVTNDNDYYYYELPDIDSVVIQQIQYWESTPIHLIVGSKQASVEYSAKTAPSSALTYSSIADMEAVSCPTVGVGQYCYTNGQAYKYSSNEEWVTAQDSELAVKGVFVDGTAKMLPVGAITSIPKNLIISGQNSANYDYTLKSVYVGNGVTSIGDDAFTSCKGISSVTLSNDVTTIGDSAFWADEGILRFNSDINGVMNISDSVTSIGFYAFTNLNNITTLNIGSGMTVIGSVFPSMTGLTAVTIPNTITKIGSAAFYNCYSLKTVIIPSGVTRIEAAAFRQCSGLTKVCCLATTPPTMTNNNVFESTNNCPIYVPSQSVSAYKSATNWSTYASRIQAIPLQWISVSSGSTIPKGIVYGVKINSQNAGRDYGNGFEIGTDSNNCAWFGAGAPTRAPQFTAYFYTIANGVSTLENSWDDGDKEFIFSNYSGANYYYEDGTKTAPYNIQLYMYA